MMNKYIETKYKRPPAMKKMYLILCSILAFSGCASTVISKYGTDKEIDPNKERIFKKKYMPYSDVLLFSPDTEIFRYAFFSFFPVTIIL